MKKLMFFYLILLSSVNPIQAQVASSCIISSSLAVEYEQDLKTLAMRRMFQFQSPDTAIVRIPQKWIDTISEGLAAIFNASSIPERDTVFDYYCIHAKTNDPTVPYVPLYNSYNDILIKVDTSFSWTQSWQNLNAISGNPLIDGLVTTYNLSISQFYNWMIGNYSIVHSDSLLNIYALIDSLELDPALSMGEADALIGTAGAICYKKIGNIRYYDFSFQWNDCFDGCDNQKTWKFQVNPDCSVEYLGSAEWGFFGVLPLPEPINCHSLATIPEYNSQIETYTISPSPAENTLIINSGKKSNYSILEQTGRVIQKGQLILGSNSVDISKFLPGTYWIKLGEHGEYTQKIIKI